MSRANVKLSHRVSVPNDSTHKSITVQFVHRGKRDAVIEKVRITRVNRSNFVRAKTGPVFVNVPLRPNFRNLIGQRVSKKEFIL